MMRFRSGSLVVTLLAVPLALGACAKDDGDGDGVGTDSSGADSATGDGDGGDGDGDGDGDGGDGDGDGDVADFGPARGDFAIGQVEVSQSIAQPVWVNGSNVAPGDRNVQLVRNRFTIVRALWTIPPGWSPRPMMARLYVRQADGSETSYVDYLTLTGNPVVPEANSSETQIGESFFWRIDPELVQPGMNYRIEVLEAADASDIPESSVGNVYPPEGYTDLFISSEPSVIKVALVGVRYNANGCVSDTSDILPDSPRAEEFEALRAGFERWNAVETDKTFIDTSISTDIDYPVGSVQDLLGVVGQIRAQYATSIPDAFFYIAWDDCAPAPGGVLGIAPLGNENPTPQGASQRYASGLWNPRQNLAYLQESINTAVHEVGHNQGAPHAPCGVPQSDPSYPYPQASIGTRGLDPLDGKTYPPSDYTDFMSYCRPYWVSDYRWRKSFSHQSTMTSWGGSKIAPPEPEGDFQEAVMVGLVTPDGSGDRWWINSRYEEPADATVLADVAVQVRTADGESLAMPTQTFDVPDIPGAFMVEVPLYGDLDPQEIASMHVEGRLMDFEVESPEIRDYRDMEFTVKGEPFAQFKELSQ